LALILLNAFTSFNPISFGALNKCEEKYSKT
jgi:hypothetical protein